MALLFPGANVFDAILRALQHGQPSIGLTTVLQLDLPPVALDERGPKRLSLGIAPGEIGLDRPVLDRNEGVDLALAIDDQTDGYRLNPPGRKAAAHLLPQQRTEP